MSESMELAARMLAKAKRDLDAAKSDHAAAVEAMQDGSSDMREAHEAVRQARDALVTAAESRGDVIAAAETVFDAKRHVFRLASEERAIKERCFKLQQRVTELEAEYRNALKRVEDAALDMVKEPAHG